MMNGDGKSDSSIVPEKPPNKATQVAAEVVEGRELAKGNLPECNTPRTLSRTDVPSALRRVCQAARRDNVSSGAIWRYDPRQEPDAVVPHVRICGGGRGQP